MQFRKKNREAFVNFLRAHYDRVTGATVVRSLPYYMLVDSTSICPLRCPYCPTGAENEQRRTGGQMRFRNRATMSRYLYDAILEEMGRYLFFMGLYNWGEPLLNKDLPYFIGRAAREDILTEIHTSLSLEFPDEAMKELLLSGIDIIIASIDGFSQETYQRYRVGGNFELAKRNIGKLAALKKELGTQTMIVWKYLLFSFNEHEAEAIDRHCAERGIVPCRREACIDITANPDWLPSHRKVELERKAPPAVAPPAPETASCAWHYLYSIVNADGSVSPCCAPWEQEHDFGVVAPGKATFASVWNNERFVRSRGALSAHPGPHDREIGTICLPCPFDSYVKDQYTPWDADVVKRFQEAGVGDRVLRKAFSLLARSPRRFARYMRRKGLAAVG